MTTLADARTPAAVAATAGRGKRTILLSLAALAALVGATAAVVYSQQLVAGVAREVTAASEVRSEDQLGAMPASLKVRCIMPRAWRRDCPADER